MTPYTPEEIALAHTLAYRAVPERLRHQARAAAYRGALLGIRATTERAAQHLEIHWGHIATPEMRDALRENHHLKDHPDAG